MHGVFFSEGGTDVQRDERPTPAQPECGSGAAEGAAARPARHKPQPPSPPQPPNDIPLGMPASPEEFERMKRAARDPDTGPEQPADAECEEDEPPKP